MEAEEKKIVYMSGPAGCVPSSVAISAVFSFDGVPIFEADASDRERVVTLMKCDAIYMMRGWRKDRMAKLLHFVALKLGMKIMLEK